MCYLHHQKFNQYLHFTFYYLDYNNCKVKQTLQSLVGFFASYIQALWHTCPLKNFRCAAVSLSIFWHFNFFFNHLEQLSTLVFTSLVHDKPHLSLLSMRKKDRGECFFSQLLNSPLINHNLRRSVLIANCPTHHPDKLQIYERKAFRCFINILILLVLL